MKDKFYSFEKITETSADIYIYTAILFPMNGTSLMYQLSDSKKS